MKNPFKQLKHLFKDPVNTIDEANARKKEIMPWFYVSIAIAALFGILDGILGTGFLMIFALVGIAGVMVFGFLLFALKKIRARFEVLTCDKCKTLAQIKSMEDYKKYISYTVESNKAVFSGYTGSKELNKNNEYPSVRYSATSVGILSVSLTCPNCGAVKQLKYDATPFKCHAEEKNVSVARRNAIAGSLEAAVKSAVDDYNNNRPIPYSIHSSKNAHFEERTTFKGANAGGAHPKYKDVVIDMHQDLDEMIEHYFVLNQMNGELSDPNKPAKPDKKAKK